MQRREMLITTATLLGSAAVTGCATLDGGWTTLVDGTKVPGAAEGWTTQGEGNWSVVDGALQGKGGKLGYLVAPGTHANFEIEAEFWADADCNSGIFIRCQDRAKIAAASAYEVNIFDKRPDPLYGTGAIVDFAKVRQPMPKAADRWNTFRITAQGERLVVVFNGETTADIRNGQWKSGAIALQSAGGTVRFRKVRMRTLSA